LDLAAARAAATAARLAAQAEHGTVFEVEPAFDVRCRASMTFLDVRDIVVKMNAVIGSKRGIKP
jgi:hypothetical protein